ncbi:hypothetical protein RUM43_009917 [Polyplax serrata]|uniref:Uncharacterized protein n=1 Tax=Polyplax serrata TaxID=468196 RepID=A0AAN8NZL8_POLSC
MTKYESDAKKKLRRGPNDTLPLYRKFNEEIHFPGLHAAEGLNSSKMLDKVEKGKTNGSELPDLKSLTMGRQQQQQEQQ